MKVLKMRHRYFSTLLPLAALILISAGIFSACDLLAGKGGGTETESSLEVVGQSVYQNGHPAVSARVTVRASDYLADPVSPSDPGETRRETFTDPDGRFHLKDLPAGSYRVEVAGPESGGYIQDFTLGAKGGSLKLPPDTLYNRGGIQGVFAPDSEVQLARFVQVYGMERFVKADPTGVFLLGNLPPGAYDIRCSSLQPFRRDAILKGVVVASGQVTSVPDVILTREAKLTFGVDSAGLHIEGMEVGSPLILDNESWDNGIENEYVWMKASLGLLQLKGNIVTEDLSGDLKTSIAEQILACQSELRRAQLAGLQNLVDPVAGAGAKMVLPASGRIEDILPIPSVGSDLIVAEARKATPEKPLIVVVGGPLTTVANAYLSDPTIASRMVVAGAFSFTVNSADTIANYVVAKKCRFVEWGRTYAWGGTPDTLRVQAIPKSIMGQSIKTILHTNPNLLGYGDVAPVVYLYNTRIWTMAKMVKVSRNLAVQAASDITFDFLDIPQDANNFVLSQDEVLGTFADSNAYHPYTLPGSIPSAGFIGNSGIFTWALDSITGSIGVTFPVGSWTEYRVSVPVAGKYALIIRYRCTEGGRFAIGTPTQPSATELNLPPSVNWAEATADSVSLGAGVSILRIGSLSGKVDIEGIEIP